MSLKVSKRPFKDGSNTILGFKEPAASRSISLGIIKRIVDCFDRVHQHFALTGSHRIGFVLRYRIQYPATVRIVNDFSFLW